MIACSNCCGGTRTSNGAGQRVGHDANACLHATCDYIDANLNADLSLGGIATAVGVRPHRLARDFRDRTGVPLHQYVLGRRVERVDSCCVVGHADRDDRLAGVRVRRPEPLDDRVPKEGRRHPGRLPTGLTFGVNGGLSLSPSSTSGRGLPPTGQRPTNRSLYPKNDPVLASPRTTDLFEFAPFSKSRSGGRAAPGSTSREEQRMKHRRLVVAARWPRSLCSERPRPSR